MELPNVKWVQNELGISFTKLKSMMDCLENRGFIKISSKKDHRIKFIDITDGGKEFFIKVAQTYNGFLLKPLHYQMKNEIACINNWVILLYLIS